MKIVHLNTSDGHGGAARAIYRIHRGLIGLGEDSCLLVRHKSTSDPTVIHVAPSPRFTDSLYRRARRRAIAREHRRYLENKPSGFEVFGDDRTDVGSELIRGLPPADVVMLNWVAGFVESKRFFPRLPSTTPVVWRLPDMYPFTGGCHYASGCGRYVDSCGSCPQIASPGPRDLSHQIWLRKSRAYGKLGEDQLHVVALSTKQALEVRASSLLGRFPVTVIPCAVDVETFSPQPQAAARERLGLPLERPIILMVAWSFQRARKGAALLEAALASGAINSAKSPLALTVGRDDPGFRGPLEHRHWGPVDDDQLLVLLYSAADVLAFASLEETFGQTIVEALACGLPVVGFDSGGVRDAVTPGVTGFMAGANTAEALSSALASAIDDLDGLRAMRSACRATAEAKFSADVVARRYQELYRSLTAI